jgi:PAP2 superfamily
MVRRIDRRQYYSCVGTATILTCAFLPLLSAGVDKTPDAHEAERSGFHRTVQDARQAANERSSVVLRWNEAVIAAAKKQSPPPALLARNLAVFHLACWHALEAVPEDPSTDSLVFSAAAYRVSILLYPSYSAEFDALAIATGLPSASGSLTASAGTVAETLVRSRQADGSTMTVNYKPRTNPGQWRRTGPNRRPPELPQWSGVVPFVLKSADQFRPDPPPAISSKEFLGSLDEIRRLGGAESKDRTEEQTMIARFWSDFSYTTSPPGHWNDIARGILAQRGLNLRRTAELFAVMNVAMADSGIAAWECKYHYNFWRPVTALGGSWQPLLNTPPHPEYVSGHAAFSGAAAVVLEHFLGQKVEFSANSDTLKDQQRTFTNFQKCAEEIAASRVYGGIHYRFSGRAGLTLGRSIGVYVVERFETKSGELQASAHGVESNGPK